MLLILFIAVTHREEMTYEVGGRVVKRAEKWGGEGCVGGKRHLTPAGRFIRNQDSVWNEGGE